MEQLLAQLASGGGGARVVHLDGSGNAHGGAASSPPSCGHDRCKQRYNMVHRVRKLQKSRKGARVRAQLGKMRVDIEENKYGGTDAEKKTWADDVQAVLVAHREIAAIPDLAAYERVATTARDTYRRLFGSEKHVTRWAAKTIPHALGKRYVALLPAADP